MTTYRSYENVPGPEELKASGVGQLITETMEARGLNHAAAMEAVRVEHPVLWASYMARGEKPREIGVENFTFAGRPAVRTYDATGGEIRSSVPLSQLASEYRIQGIVGDRLIPVVTVPKISGVAPLFGRDDYARVLPIARPPATESNVAKFSTSSVFFTCQGFGLKYPLPVELELNTDVAWNLRYAATRFVTSQILTTKESEVFSLLDSTSNVGTTYTVESAWGTGGDPVATVETAIRRVQDVSGFRPNLVAFGRSAWRDFSGNATALGKLGQLATPDRAAEVLRLPAGGVVVAEGVYKSGEGYVPFFDDRVFVGYTGEGEVSPRWGVTASWRPRGNEANRFITEILPKKSSHVAWIEVGGWEQPLVADPQLAVTLFGTNSSQEGGI